MADITVRDKKLGSLRACIQARSTVAKPTSDEKQPLGIPYILNPKTQSSN